MRPPPRSTPGRSSAPTAGPPFGLETPTHAALRVGSPGPAGGKNSGDRALRVGLGRPRRSTPGRWVWGGAAVGWRATSGPAATFSARRRRDCAIRCPQKLSVVRSGCNPRVSLHASAEASGLARGSRPRRREIIACCRLHGGSRWGHKKGPGGRLQPEFFTRFVLSLRLRTRRMLEFPPPASPRCVSTQGGPLVFQVTLTSSCSDLGGSDSRYDHGAVRNDHQEAGGSSSRRTFRTVAPRESRFRSALAQRVDVSLTFQAAAAVSTGRFWRSRPDSGTQITSASQATTRTPARSASPPRCSVRGAGADSAPLIGAPIRVRLSVRARTRRCEEFRIHTETFRSSFGRTRSVRRRNESDDFYRSCSPSAAPSW